MLRHLILCLIAFAFLSCGKIYYDRNNEKFRSYQNKDKDLVGQEQLKQHPFDLDKFLHPDCDSCSLVQYVTPSDIKVIAQQKEELLVVFYYPPCKAAEGYIKLAKAAEERNVPYMLISLSNSPKEMKKWYTMAALKNKNCYILPSDIYGTGMSDKEKKFVSDLCASCYTQYKDELLYAQYVFIKDKGNSITVLNLENEIYTTEDALQWLIQNYPLTRSLPTYR